jgi:hypothetical protein
VNVGKRGARATVGAPGTGLSFSAPLGGAGSPVQPPAVPAGCQALGWVAAILVGLVALGQCTTKNTPPPVRAAQAPVTTSRSVDARSLNCRSQPTATAPTVRSFARNDRLQILGEEDGWSHVAGYPDCWASSRYLSDGSAPVAATAGAAGASGVSSLYSQPARLKVKSSAGRKTRPARKSRSFGKQRSYNTGSACPCSGSRICIGPRGGRYCITSGGNKRYGV